MDKIAFDVSFDNSRFQYHDFSIILTANTSHADFKSKIVFLWSWVWSASWTDTSSCAMILEINMFRYPNLTGFCCIIAVTFGDSIIAWIFPSSGRYQLSNNQRERMLWSVLNPFTYQLKNYLCLKSGKIYMYIQSKQSFNCSLACILSLATTTANDIMIIFFVQCLHLKIIPNRSTHWNANPCKLFNLLIVDCIGIFSKSLWMALSFFTGFSPRWLY